MQRVESGTPINIAATAAVGTRSGTLLGFYVNNKTAGATLVLTHGSAAGGAAITGTVTPLIGFHRLRMYCPSGVYATIAVQPMDITFFYAGG
jgi:hypothetical protein